ncbi:MAG: ferritin-like domain-containing protein [Kofleriaceae bacterium]|jgi:bacterioferritin (cytochrome b1)|nr:ferritin-like domain-containing protein [Kofleriaceae bacterium]MBP6841526.1 ferritin-like domain-containing protein [Kofleriaceae bacterium]MBP9208105.1 ferritin-like domain-containing protein [Kofleriaceae bacterium]
MLLTREEMSFDFAGHKLDPNRDREVLEWMFNQFLYGEMTGIQIGHWLYDAPDVESARFLARQSLEEMQHVDNFLRIMNSLGLEPKPAHPMVRFLATGMMGGSWAEHVALEMAQGEGFVLMAFYAVIDSLDHKPSVDILRRAVKQEERHVEFGEQQTMKAIAGKSGLRRRLLGMSLVSMWAVRRLARFMATRLPKDHAVLARLPEFLALSNQCAETRLRRMGVLDRPLAELSGLRRALLVTEAYAGKALGGLASLLTLPLRILPFWPKKKRLTDIYLRDPHVAGYKRLSAGAPPDEPASEAG